MSSRTSLALRRGAGFFLLWLVLLQSVKAGDLAVGLVATVCATWASLHLLPPGVGEVHMLRLATFLPHFLWQSLLAGVDVARRAFAPTPRLRAGFVAELRDNAELYPLGVDLVLTHGDRLLGLPRSTRIGKAR